MTDHPMTEREASREKFEEFWISRYKDEKVGRRALNDDDYGYVSRDWLFWQASRKQALEEVAALFPQPHIEYFGDAIADAIRSLTTTGDKA